MKPNNKRFSSFPILLILIFFTRSFGQSSPPSGSLLPPVSPPSPDVTSLAKYGNYEVSLFTGLPQINVPLYTIKDGELEVPISINYHASGIKVNETESCVGLGWSLDAGGMITRQVEGLPDEQPYNYLSGAVPVKKSSDISSPLNTGDLDYVQSVSNGVRDLEPDIFSYSFPGTNGKFVFNCKDNFKPIIIPFNPIQINRFASDQNSINFDIIDESGVKYTFGDKELTTANFSSNISSWRLSNITSSNKSKVIRFIYASETVQQEDIADFETITDGGTVYDPSNSTATSYTYSNSLSNKYSRPVYTQTIERKLSEIYFTNGKIVFNSTGRQLNSIIVYSGLDATTGYKPIRSFNFYYSYFIKNNDESTKRLRLDSVQMRGSTIENIQTYKFGYNTNQILPEKLSKSRDYWGYYNNAYNSTLVPGRTIKINPPNGAMAYDFHVGGTDVGRDPDPVYMQANILNRVTYPSGGYSDFEYETNQYDDGSVNGKLAGGLRIKLIKSYDGVSTSPSIKSYKYGVGENGLGSRNFNMDEYSFKIAQTGRLFLGPDNYTTLQATKNITTYTSSPSLDINAYDGSPVVYPIVTEYAGTVANNSGKTIYTFKDERDMFQVISFVMTKPKVSSMQFARGLLRSKEVFKKTISSSWQRVQTVENQYEAFPRTSIDNIGFIAYKMYTNNGSLPPGTVNGDLPSSSVNGWCNDSYSYQYANYGISASSAWLQPFLSLIAVIILPVFISEKRFLTAIINDYPQKYALLGIK